MRSPGSSFFSPYFAWLCFFWGTILFLLYIHCDSCDWLQLPLQLTIKRNLSSEHMTQFWQICRLFQNDFFILPLNFAFYFPILLFYHSLLFLICLLKYFKIWFCMYLCKSLWLLWEQGKVYINKPVENYVVKSLFTIMKVGPEAKIRCLECRLSFVWLQLCDLI